MRTLASVVLAATVYPGESSQWRVGGGDEHGVEPVPSDAVDCSSDSFGVLYFGGTGGSAYAEIIFTGNTDVAVYGLVSPFGGTVEVFVDGTFAFAFEQLQIGTGPVHCAYMGTTSPPEINTFTQHTLRVVYSGDAQHRGFIVNATTGATNTSPPLTTIIPPASASPAPSTTGTPAPLSPQPTQSSHRTARAIYPIAVSCSVVGLVLVSLALCGLTSWWRKRRAMRAPSAAFRAEGGHSFRPQMSEKAAPAPEPQAGPSTV
ncbi:hypothetical protein EXIGLDRAFT_721427 [Exidia glandulosa HHB12029]|uniref:Uncharacterized protein n=1 Tax=Exidia glandulosa HHB12029 TaxID=1314781 RepID=A0A165FRB4_EXIGL|nr:hypothetical protein EXIGLDRAFT_721427 [Exidia glandulosa HHB12029]